MDRFDSPPLPLSPAVRAGDFNAAQLIFYDVDHSGQSFRAIAFLNGSEADAGTALEPDADSYAGHFTIFGHGGCVGDEGHCKVPEVQKDPFDRRPLHALTPQTKIINVTDALKRVCADEPDREHLQVTVLPVLPGEDGAELGDVLFFSAMRLVTFGSSRLS